MRSFVAHKILFWLPMPVIGTLNGLFRGLIIMRFLSEFYAKQVSSVMLIALLFFYTGIVFPRLGIKSAKEAWTAGAIWMLLTIGFEFLLGYLLKHPLNVILQEYDLVAGNLWTVVLLAILLLPYVHFRLTLENGRKTSNI